VGEYEGVLVVGEGIICLNVGSFVGSFVGFGVGSLLGDPGVTVGSVVSDMSPLGPGGQSKSGDGTFVGIFVGAGVGVGVVQANVGWVGLSVG